MLHGLLQAHVTLHIISTIIMKIIITIFLKERAVVLVSVLADIQIQIWNRTGTEQR